MRVRATALLHRSARGHIEFCATKSLRGPPSGPSRAKSCRVSGVTRVLPLHWAGEPFGAAVLAPESPGNPLERCPRPHARLGLLQRTVPAWHCCPLAVTARSLVRGRHRVPGGVAGSTAVAARISALPTRASSARRPGRSAARVPQEVHGSECCGLAGPGAVVGAAAAAEGDSCVHEHAVECVGMAGERVCLSPPTNDHARKPATSPRSPSLHRDTAR